MSESDVEKCEDIRIEHKKVTTRANVFKLHNATSGETLINPKSTPSINRGDYSHSDIHIG